MKVNYLGIAAGTVALISVFLPWFSIELWTENLGSTMNFSANLYQLTGTVEGITKSMFLPVWFNISALVLMTATAAGCFVASLINAKKRTLLLGLCGCIALISMAVFAGGLSGSNFAVERLNPGYTISQFPEGTFGLSAENSMQNSYDYSWAIGYGFWLALVAAMLAVISAILSRKKSS